MGTAAIARLPKIDLHCHVDGSARPATLLELAREAGLPLPAGTVAELQPLVRAAPGCRSLDAFLAVFDTFYPVLRVPGAMGRVARELVEDAAADGTVHLEARFCPALQAGGPGEAGADHARRTSEDVLRETLEGLAAGERAVRATHAAHAARAEHAAHAVHAARAAAGSAMTAGAIVCLYRSLPFDANAELLELALRYAGRGVAGIDLAGPERLPAEPLAPLFRRAREAGLPVTVHAGEAAGPESVREALDRLGARRIGHGVAAVRDPGLVRRLAGEGVPLECCLTSNVQTGAAGSLAEHPFEALRAAGVAVTLCTDDPAVCGTTLGRELALAAAQWGYDARRLAGLQLAAAEAAFVSPARRAELRAAVLAAAGAGC